MVYYNNMARVFETNKNLNAIFIVWLDLIRFAKAKTSN